MREDLCTILRRRGVDVLRGKRGWSRSGVQEWTVVGRSEERRLEERIVVERRVEAGREVERRRVERRVVESDGAPL